MNYDWWIGRPPIESSSFDDGMVVCSDALEMLQALRDEIADIIFLDPPFNLGKLYGSNGRKSDLLDEVQYFEYMQKVLERSISILKKGGALYLYHLPRWAIRFSNFLLERMDFRHWIAISMKNNFPRGKRLYPAHYALLYFTKGEPLFFERPKINPTTCRHCKKYIKDYGGYKKYINNGINLSDIWDDLSPVRHAKYKHRLSNELPADISQRIVTISGCSDGLFIDPFAGAGTSLICAREKGMRFIGCDREPEYFNIIKQRIEKASDIKKQGVL